MVRSQKIIKLPRFLNFKRENSWSRQDPKQHTKAPTTLNTQHTTVTEGEQGRAAREGEREKAREAPTQTEPDTDAATQAQPDRKS